MKDYLKDLIDHTHGLGVIDLIKVTGTDTETNVNALAENKTVLIDATFNDPIADFIGTFGMPNLGKLKTILGFDDYNKDATISVTREDRNGVDTPIAIHFQTQNNDFVNDYRLMSKNLIEEKVKDVKFKGAQWNIEFEPTIAGIQRLKKQAQANSEEAHFTIKTENNDLKIYFGEPATHSGNFVFQTSISGKLNNTWKWPVAEFIGIMDLVGDKKIRLSDAGIAEVVVDSGIATYTYYLPANTK
jgi:hypothetical protein